MGQTCTASAMCTSTFPSVLTKYHFHRPGEADPDRTPFRPSLYHSAHLHHKAVNVTCLYSSAVPGNPLNCFCLQCLCHCWSISSQQHITSPRSQSGPPPHNRGPHLRLMIGPASAAPAAVVVEARTVLEAGDATLTASSPAPALADTVVTTSVLTAKGGGSSGSGGGFLGLFTKRQKTNDVVAAQPLATEVAASSEQGPRTMPTDSSRDVSSGSGSSRAVEPQGQRSVTERQPAMESADAGAGVVVAGTL